MDVQVSHKQIVGEIKEHNRFFRALREIKEIAENIDKNNFDVQSDLIAEKCKQVLKSGPNILSKKTKQLIEDYEGHLESILSGEIYENFHI